MLVRELIRIGSSGFIGLVLGVLMWLNHSPWYIILVCPLFIIGIVYGGCKILSWGGHVFGAWVSGLFFNGINGCLIKIIFLIVALIVLVTIGWIVGCILAGVALYNAICHDSFVGKSNSNNNYGYPHYDDPSDSYRGGYDDWDTDKITDKNSGNKSIKGRSDFKDDDGFDF